MLEIELADGNGRLDLLPKTEIDFEQEFNLYNFDFIEGTKTWTFKLPKTPNNIRLIGLQSLIEARSVFENRIQVNINVNSDFWKTGLLYFDQESLSEWSVYFAGEAGLMKQLFTDSYLTDYQLPSVTGITNVYTHAKDVAAAGPASYSYTFAEVYLPQADFDSSEIPLPFANYLTFNDTTQKWSGFAGEINGLYWPLIPFPYVKSILQEIADQLGVSFSGKLWENDEFSRLVFFNTKCLNGVDIETGRPTLYPANEIYLRNHVPKIKVTDLLKDIGRFFNQIIIYDDRSSTISFFHREDLLSAKLNDKLRYQVSTISQNFRERRKYRFESPFKEEDVIASNKVSDDPSDLTGILGGDQTTLVKTEFGTLPMRTYGGLFQEVVPVSTMNFNEDNPNIFLFFSYRKSTRFASGGATVFDKVPFVRSDINYPPPVGEVKDLHGLQWKGGSGLFERWWKAYVNALIDAKVLKVSLMFTSKELSQFDPLAKYILFNYICVFENLKGKITSNKILLEGQVLKL
jgi:hypothetical protein